MSMIYAHTTRKTDLLCKIVAFKPGIHDTYDTNDLSVIEPHMSKRCIQINTHRLLERAPVKIARANHVDFP